MIEANVNSVPPVLRCMRNWLVWRVVQKEGAAKPSKIPYYVSGAVRDGQPGTPEDRAALVTYDEAIQALGSGRYDGIGFAPMPDAGVVALDFDNCIGPGGAVDPRIAMLCSGTYTEISPSGNGLRALLLGSLPTKRDNVKPPKDAAPGWRRPDGKFDVEFYGTTGFVTITGNVWDECAMLGFDTMVAPVSDAVYDLYVERFGAPVVVMSGEGSLDDLWGLNATLGWTIEKAREILFACPATTDREHWLNALMAMHYEFDGSAEALDLVDEWSKTGENYGGRRDVEGRWRSFGKRSSLNPITGKWLMKWRSECQAHEKYEAASTWKQTLEQTADEFTLREKVCIGIAKDERLDDLGREALAQALFDAFKRLGTKYPIAQCRKLLVPRIVGKRENDAPKDLPDWLDGWLYVTDDDKFYRVNSEQWVTVQGFNAMFNRHLPRDEDGAIDKSASSTALEDYRIKTVTRSMYLPWGGPMFEMHGVDYVNLYRPSSVPEAAGSLDADGREAVKVVQRHLNLICSGRKEVMDVLTHWMAHNVQHPGVKIRWAPVIKGIPGDGKTMLGELMAAVMGHPNVRNVSSKVLGTDFTSWASGRAIVLLEELKLTGHNKYDIFNALKPYITNDSVEIHPKGKDGFEAINTTNYLGFTNFNDALPLDETDRRWLVIFSPFLTVEELERAVGQFGLSMGAYFDRLHKAIALHSASLRRWLLDVKIPASFEPNGRAPMTEEKNLMIGMSVTDEHMAVSDVLDAGGLGITKSCFTSRHMGHALSLAGAELELNGAARNRLFARCGFSRLPHKVKWNGESHVIWVQGSRIPEPEEVRRLLNPTRRNDISGNSPEECNDLFGDLKPELEPGSEPTPELDLL